MRHQLPIVSAAYPMKVIPTRWMVNPVQPEERRGDLLLKFMVMDWDLLLSIDKYS